MALGAAALFTTAGLASSVIYWKHRARQQALEQKVEAAARDRNATVEALAEHADKIAALRARLLREPCDRSGIIKLGEALMRAGDARGTIGQAKEFLTKCGEYPRLRWLTYAAYNQLSEWDLAAAEATKLIESNSYDADYRTWRGITYEKKGDLAKAAEDYQQALILRPGLTDVPLNLADAYEKLGRPCDAILPLAQVVVQHPTVSNIGALQARVEALSTLPQCAWAAGEGHARIKINPGSQVMMVKVRVNDRQTGDFVVDTGATLVTLSRRFADRLQIATTGGPSLLAQTANGVTSGALVALDKLELQGIHAARVPAAVVENLGTVDGLLGMSFLSRFDLHRSQAVLAIDARSAGTK